MELAGQVTLVEELRDFLDEVRRVAPLWDPHFDDGVLVNFSILLASRCPTAQDMAERAQVNLGGGLCR